jgi:hypothetical protein
MEIENTVRSACIRCRIILKESGGRGQMFNRKYHFYPIVALTCIVLSFASLSAATNVAPGTPKVWGYGVKSCADFVNISKGFEVGNRREVIEYLHFREWFSGMVTGLSLATSSNVLKGAEIKGAMRRLRLHCEEHPQDDFFQAANAYLRLLSSPDDNPK